MLAVQVLMKSEPKFAVLGEETTRSLLGKTALATIDDNMKMFGIPTGEVKFDQLFNAAGDIWAKAGYVADKVSAERVRNVSFVKPFYEAPGKGCREFETSVLPVAFPAGLATLSAEAKAVLGDEKISVQLSSHSGVRFCVEASLEAADDPQRGREIKLAREEAVIQYLIDHYNRPRSQFVPASGDEQQTNNEDKSIPCVRLRLNGATEHR
jgi:hypothetical protein